MRAVRLAASALLFGPIGCGGASATAPAPHEAALTAPASGVAASSGTAVERFFPLVDGRLYEYRTMSELGEEGLLVARVHRTDATHGELRYPSGTKRFEYTPEGVKNGEGAFVLKAPLEVGASFRGEHGGTTRIVSTSASATTRAGTFSGCVQTTEERLGDRPVRYTTTFCPDVGIVALEAAGPTTVERAELRSYGAPTSIGPDGLQRIP